LLGDKGVQLINIYRELEECRWVELPTHQVSPHLLGPTEGNVIAALPETLVLPDWAVVSSKLYIVHSAADTWGACIHSPGGASLCPQPATQLTVLL
jgi:hypothetical protein